MIKTDRLSRRVRRREACAVAGCFAWICSFWLAGVTTAIEPPVGGQSMFWDATVTSAALLELPDSLAEEPPPAPEPMETELSEPLPSCSSCSSSPSWYPDRRRPR